jgi:geranylgeranyl pyrophosphate synthase
MYLGMISMKSASQIECACHVGAFLATKDQKLIRDFTKFGQNLGMASQISNDLMDIRNGKDIMRQKATMPVIYALNQVEGETLDYLKGIFVYKHSTATDVVRVRDLIFLAAEPCIMPSEDGCFRVGALDILEKNAARGLTWIGRGIVLS